jgi:hypothetical protein
MATNREVPNVNLMLGYVDCLRNKKSDDTYVLENFGQRRFYSSTQDYDYVKYVNTGSKEKIDYIDYSGNKEKSHGVFNQNGLMSPEEIKVLREKLRNTDSVIWHGVISFTEEFGDKYCDNYEKAYELMKAELPKFFTKAELNPDNIEWFAGLHENTDNKHIHFSFFEKEPQRYRQNTKKKVYSQGLISKKAINYFKGEIERKLINVSKDIVGLRTSIKEEVYKGLKKEDFTKLISSLVYILPETGRMSYDSENLKPYKASIDYVVKSIIKSNKELNKKYDDFKALLIQQDKQIANSYTKMHTSYEGKLLKDKYIEDLYRRLGNLVVHTVKDIRTSQRKYNYETADRLISKRIEKRKKQILLRKCFQLNDLVNQEMVSSFQEFLDKLEQAKYKRMREEGYFDEQD